MMDNQYTYYESTCYESVEKTYTFNGPGIYGKTIHCHNDKQAVNICNLLQDALTWGQTSKAIEIRKALFIE